MTSSYTAFDASVPASTQNGLTFATSANANDAALWYGIVSGLMPGFSYAFTGPIDLPQTQIWNNGAYAVRHTLTWGNSGGEAGNLKTVIVDVSQDYTPGGGNWARVGTVNLMYDGVGNVQTNSGGGMLGWIASLIGKVKTLATSFTAHSAMMTGAHGMPSGTMAAQGYNNVNITGGVINGTAIGSVNPAAGWFTHASELVVPPSAPLAPGATVTADWNNGGTIINNTNTSNIVQFANVPSAGPTATHLATHTLVISNFANLAFPNAVTWGAGGKPVIAGAVVVQLVTVDGGVTVYGIIAWRGV